MFTDSARVIKAIEDICGPGVVLEHDQIAPLTGDRCYDFGAAVARADIKLGRPISKTVDDFRNAIACYKAYRVVMPEIVVRTETE